MTLFSRIALFFVSSLALIWSSSVFAGTLSDISISSTSYAPGATATYTIQFTTENAVPAGPYSAIYITTNSVSWNNFNFNSASVSLTVDWIGRATDGVYPAGQVIHTYITGSINAWSEVVMTISNVINPGWVGSYGFFDFRTRTTGTDPIDTGNPSPIIITNPDTTAPTLSQEEDSIETYTNDTTPSYTFTSNEAGTITYGGSCSSEATAAVVGTNTITFDELEEGTYDDCTIIVEDAHENVSETLEVSEFTVDTTDPILTVIRDIPSRTNGGLEHEFTISEECDFLAEHPLSTLWEVEAIIAPTGEENTFSARVNGAQRGGTYSFSFLCRDQANNASNMLTVGPFTITGGGGGGSPASAEETPISGDTPTEATVKWEPVPIPESETPKTEETPTVIPQKEKYEFLVDITPKRKNSEKDVRALQTFFNQYEGEKLSVNGIYDAETISAVNRFQLKYASEILAPWDIDYATGNVAIYTRKKIQEMMELS